MAKGGATLQQVRTSNDKLKTYTSGLVALFIGATSGIGKGTLTQLAHLADAPTVYIVGRSKSAFAPHLQELEKINPRGKFVFMETQISLIKNVDQICDEIKQKERKVDILFLSAGCPTWGGINDTTEGIDTLSSLIYYGRIRAIFNLLSLLEQSDNPRVISVLGGGNEKPIDSTDLEVRKNYSVIKSTSTALTKTTLVFEKIAESNPAVSFIHWHPGLVNTGQVDRFFQSMTGLWVLLGFVARWILLPVFVNPVSRSVSEAGEWGVYLATSAAYPPAQPRNGTTKPGGVPTGEGLKPAVGSVPGVYLIDKNGASVTKSAAVLERLREERMGEKVWDDAVGVWRRALGSQ